MTPTDEELMAAMARGDEDALSELHRRYSPYLYAMARRMLRQREDVEQCVQDAFFNAWKAAGRFDPSRASAKTWLVTIAHRRVLQELRDRPDAALELEEWDAPTPATDQLDHVVAQRAVSVLGEDQRRLVELAFYQGYSHSELAQITGLPLGTVKTRLRSALDRMRRFLEVRGDA
ncbi:sigma-70 family RNA polymerase sigma factor [Deinococcus pimensis]|uniref:sigma-70 family RNA polymerase sigma factor n=1 Tax=Deinococcus pimensis TaxID=309888 RepID=UPI0004811DDD|nr:sigma-70 family RNA polymerase sigma factor [Deinococcus pimensis]